MQMIFSNRLSLICFKTKTSYRRLYSTQSTSQFSIQETWLRQKRVPNDFWKIKENQFQYLNWLSEKLNIKTMEDWYKVSREDITQNYGSALINYNNDSHINMITSIYPNYTWLPWKFNRTPKGFWKDENNVKAYMNWLSEKLNIKTMEDWYKVTYEDFIQNYGQSLITQYNGSHINLILSVFSNYNWLPWKFNSIPKGFWDEEINVKSYMNWLSEKLNIKTMEDWYNVSREDYIQNYGGTLLNYNNESHMNIIISVYPNYNWLPWKFKQSPKGFWNDEKNIKSYVNWLSEKLNIKTMEDWYNVTYEDIIQNYGSTIILYSGSYINLITHTFPNYNWLPWKFKQSPKRFWKDENNVKAYMNWLSEKLNIKTMEDWYKVTSEDFFQNYGGTLLSQKKNSSKYSKIHHLLQKIYPEYNWNVYQFLKVPRGYKTHLLENTSAQKEFINYLEKKFDIKQTTDWYVITQLQLNQVITIDLQTAMKIIKKFYPELDITRFETI